MTMVGCCCCWCRRLVVQLAVVVTTLLLCCGLSSTSQFAGDPNNILAFNTSLAVNGDWESSGSLAVPFMECGYLFCQARDVTINATTHYWDYYVHWVIPSTAEHDPKVFVLGNKYQMPRSYLVFKGFKGNYTGQYRCLLHFRNTQLASRTLRLTLHDVPASRPCKNTLT